MNDTQAIQELVAQFADAANRRDETQWSATWADGGIWRIMPPIDMTVQGRAAEIGTTFARLVDRWAFFIHIVHHGVVSVQGDRAEARWYTTEIACAGADGAGHFNHGLYLDTLVRLPEGWRFRQRTYHYLYLDESQLSGQGFRAPALASTPPPGSGG